MALYLIFIFLIFDLTSKFSLIPTNPFHASTTRTKCSTKKRKKNKKNERKETTKKKRRRRRRQMEVYRSARYSNPSGDLSACEYDISHLLN